MQILNQTRETTLAVNARLADTFFSRLRGLLGTKSLPEGSALVIRPCNSVHMFGMRYSLDVLFVASDQHVLKMVAALAPGKVAVCPGAAYAVELPVGTLIRIGTAVGDELRLE